MRGPTPQQMKGLPKDQSVGLIPLSINEIFAHIQSDTTRQYKISVSYLEVSSLVLTATFSFIMSALTIWSVQTTRTSRLGKASPKGSISTVYQKTTSPAHQKSWSWWIRVTRFEILRRPSWTRLHPVRTQYSESTFSRKVCRMAPSRSLSSIS